MNPTSLNTTTNTSPNIINDFRFYPIDAMNPAAVGCNVGVAASSSTMNAATISTASGSLLHVIPLQMTTNGQGTIAASTASSGGGGLMSQMAIITPTSQSSRVITASLSNSNLDYQQIPQQLQTIPAAASINVLVSDAGFIGHPSLVDSFVASDISNGIITPIPHISNVSLQTATTSSTSFILPTTTITSVSIPEQNIVEDAAVIVNSTTAAVTPATNTVNKTTLLPMVPQQKITHLNKQQKTIINSSIQQLPVVFKAETVSNMMATDNFNMEKMSSTFTLPAGTALAKVRSVPFSNLGNTNHKSDITASSAIPQISTVIAAPAIQNTANIVPRNIPKTTEANRITVENNDIGIKQEYKVVSKFSNIQRASTSKQESLLKSKPVQRIIIEHSSPRTKRSKSLNSVVIVGTEDTSLERRRSIATEGKLIITQTDANKIATFTATETTTELITASTTTTTTTAVASPPTVVTTTPSDLNIDAIESEKKVEVCIKEEIDSNECNDYEEEYLEDDTTDDEKCSNTSELVLCTDENMSEILETSSSNDEKILVPVEEIEDKPTEQNQQQKSIEKTEKCKSEEIIAPADKEKEIYLEEKLVQIKEEPISEYNENVSEQLEIAPQEQKEVTTSTEQISPDKSLLCDEQVLVTSTSSAASASTNNSIKEVIPDDANADANAPTNDVNSCKSIKSPGVTADVNSYSTVLEMLSTFNMLSWKERIGTARGTNLRFQLNEFNLLQIHERCSPRYRIHTAYEKPIYERESHSIENKDPFLYLCRRCNCHGPAADFLAPEFCSLECLKRDTRKRQRDLAGIPTRKRPRKEAPTSSTVTQSLQTLQKPHPTPSLLVKKFFRWSTYLTGKHGEVAAPVDLFLNPFPTGPNNFTIGMKLEAIDPENCSLFCVCTVIDIKGYRLNLTFDGYEPMYNFWVNADSMDIFPPGWCAKTNRILQPPRGIDASKFNWPAYFAREKAIAAPRQLFTHLNSSSLPTRNGFQVGMHLEAEDLNDTGKLCVATVSDVLDDRIRIHFNGWDDCYDYWVDTNSPYIHPCGWHEGRQQLIVPPDFENSAFSWPDFLRERGSGLVAPATLFNPRDPIDFKSKMKLEVVDPRNPILIRPATVVARKGHRVKLHLDIWPNEYCFWLEDDSPDLHPIGWCDATGHDLEPPPGFHTRTALMPCSTAGCRGIGNAKYCNLITHSTRDCCPYTPENWSVKVEKEPRVENHEIERKISAKGAHLEPRNDVLRTRRSNEHRNSSTKPTNSFADSIMERLSLLDTIKTRRSLQEQQQKAHRRVDAMEESNLRKSLVKKHEPNHIMTDVVKKEKTKPSSVSDKSNCSDLFNLNIAKEYLCDYGPRLEQNYNLWQKNLSTNFSDITKNPLHWTTQESSLFVESILQCSKTAHNFVREDIDGAALLAMKQSDLTDLLNIKLGPAVKLYAHILQLRSWTVAKFRVKNELN